MHINVKDFEDRFRGEGDDFEGIIHSLVRAVGRTVGIGSHQIHWDRRTNVGDGGRDLVIEVGHPGGGGHFIPAVPSIWSIKSGEDGVKPSSLRAEITSPMHPKVQQALLAGRSYVWCAARPATHDNRDSMVAEASSLAVELGVDPALITFRWQEAITAEVNQHPNLIAVHMPELATRIGGLLTFHEWEREPGLRTDWADFGGRDVIVARVSEHLLGQDGQNVLHIAGLSGIGKTRTVLEACRRHAELQGVLYLDRHAALSRDVYRYLEDDGRHVQLVVDETTLKELPGVKSRLCDFANRVRVVTIGPAPRQRQYLAGDILILSEPIGEGDVLRVIEGPGRGLPEAVLRSIADQSRHDLRLALLITAASLKTSEYRNKPVFSVEDIWNRLMELFQIADPARFRHHYEALTVSIDIGSLGDASGELAAIAQHFGHHEDHLQRAARQAVDCGLGIQAARFFEATPHALAVRIFEDHVWPLISNRLDTFMSALSPRLRRRFLERCQNCSDIVGKEVRDRVGGIFLRSLNEVGIIALVNRENSRIFQAWAEFDPHRGLEWLRNAVESATPQQLRSIDGQTDGSGGWRGRRQLVWLCQNLASFGEHFEDCEAILFRLALHETEPSIGNNGTATWQHLFWPALAGTEVEFTKRLPIILKRLTSALPEQLPVILAAVFGAMESRHAGMLAPPEVVGGRVVPQTWNPKTHNELLALRQAAADGFIDAISSLPPTSQNIALDSVIDHLRIFREIGRHDRVQKLFPSSGIPEEQRRRLVIELDAEVSFLKGMTRHGNRPTNSATPMLEHWRSLLSTDDLATRVKDLTAGTKVDIWQENLTNPHAEIAQELVNNPETFRELKDWFESPEAKSSGELGYHTGRLDKSGSLSGTVRKWLWEDLCRTVTVTYLNGAGSLEGGLPNDWSDELDSLAGQLPELVAMATVTADVSNRGLIRLLNLVDRLQPTASRFFRPLAYGSWQPVMTVEMQTLVLETLNLLSRTGDTYSSTVGLNLLSMWWHGRKEPLDTKLIPATVDLVSHPVPISSHGNDYHWLEVLKLLIPHRPAEVARRITERITDPKYMFWSRGDPVVEVMAAACVGDPIGGMDAVGDALLDPERRPMFGTAIYRGLFEAIGLDSVRNWVTKNSNDEIKWIARHLESPFLSQDGEVVVPPLTRWLFEEHEADQRAFEWFLMGRNNEARTWTGDRTEEKRQTLRPFSNHQLRRVREWAEYELQREVQDVEFFQKWDDESGRV